MARRVHPAVKCLVLTQMAISALWSFPRATKLDEVSRTDHILSVSEGLVRNKVVVSYMYGTGLWQYWDMFAPNPIRRDVWVDAVALFPDGSEKTYTFLRLSQLGEPMRYLRERHRKYWERALAPRYRYLWPAIARHAWDELGGPSATIELRRHWRPVPPPGHPPFPYRTEVFFRWVPRAD